MKNIIKMLLNAPEVHLDEKAKSIVREWSDPPKAIEILRALDACVYGSLGSEFFVIAIEVLYLAALESEGKTAEEVESMAEWRKNAVS